VEALPSHRVLLSRWSSVVWPPPTSQPASAWISPFGLIPVVTMTVGHRPEEISPVSSSAFVTSRTPYTGEFFSAAFSGSSPIPWPSPRCNRLSSLLLPFQGYHIGAASFTLCYGLFFRIPFSGSYNASTWSVT
ncbi:MAG: hypothetical protein NTZ74_10415, partial [Chloroflexi bacterium]|nr:hypothetical protein [Chloroflexota bacterium]